MTEKQTLIARARDALRDPASSLEGLYFLAVRLREQSACGYARRLLEHAIALGPKDRRVRLELFRQLALCHSKDVDLPVATRHAEALTLLGLDDPDIEALAADNTPFVACEPDGRPLVSFPTGRQFYASAQGAAGGIHKRQWEADGQRLHLEHALGCYLRAYEAGPAPKVAFQNGYPAVNAAFVLDLLAAEEEADAVDRKENRRNADVWREQARALRQELADTLPTLDEYPDSYWLLVTHAEALFGLRRYEEARAPLGQAARLRVSDWQRAITARQLAHLSRLHRGSSTPQEAERAARALADFFGSTPAAVRSAFQGKVGLALSGGGFRASLFHIGVLARLAELDLLRTVEVLSCVSGGSIIGAYYYLEVRSLLERLPDQEITRQHYLEIVENVIQRFLEGVQQNLRTRILASFRDNVRMILQRRSRTEILAQLLEERLYSKVRDDQGNAPRELRELRITPWIRGEDGVRRQAEDFDPKNHNGPRGAKVPILILNATTLNTGHSWQFTVSYMGEPPAAIDSAVDGNPRLRRMYYADAGPHAGLRLGTAVAASACVPGLFEPITLKGLYPGRTVCLVDGGVHDNQGVASLLEQDCSVVLVSDASGQSESQASPGSSFLAVPLRSNEVLMARVRQAEYRELVALQRSGLLRGMAFIHLKKGLDLGPVDWINCPEPSGPSTLGAQDDEVTSYGVLKGVQRRLAAMRTDLDSFSEAEAYALMTSGYLMMTDELGRQLPHLAPPAQAPHPWPFLALRDAMRGPSAEDSPTQRLLAQLDVSRYRFLKPFRRMGKPAPRTWAYYAQRFITAAFGMTVAETLEMGLRPFRVALAIAVSALGALGANFHLALLDGRFLRRGRVVEILGRAGAPEGGTVTRLPDPPAPLPAEPPRKTEPPQKAEPPQERASR